MKRIFQVFLMVLIVPLILFGQSPADNSTGQSVTPNFTWTNNTFLTGGDNWRIQVATDIAFTDIVINVPLTTNGQVSYIFNSGDLVGSLVGGTNLSYNQTYYWRIRNATTSTTIEPVGPPAYYTFTTLLATPALTAPSNGATGQSINPSLSWTQSASTANVEYYIDYDLNGSTGGWDNSVGPFTSPHSLSGLALNTTYYWQIRAVVTAGPPNAGETKTSSTFTFTTINYPQILTPANGVTGVSIEPTFTWNDTYDETSFTVSISTDGSSQGNFDSNILASKTTAANATSAAFTALDAGMPLNNATKYYVQLTVNGGTYDGAKSAIFHFTTYSNLTVYLSWPSDTATLLPGDVVFSWYLTLANTGIKYTLQYMTAASAPTQESDWATATSVTTTSLNSTVSGLYAGKTYYWRVIVKKTNDEIVKYSSTYSFFISGGSSVTLYPSWPKGDVDLYSVDQRLNWYSSQYSAGFYYQVKYGTDSTDTTPDDGEMDAGTKDPTDANIVTLGTTNLFYDLTGLTPGTTYYWQVRGYYPDSDTDNDPTNGPDGWTPWSEVAAFAISNSLALQTPIPTYPIDSVAVYTTSPYVYWYYIGSTAGITFDVDYGTDSTSYTGHLTGINNLNAQLPSLVPGTTYYWRVRSNDGTNPITTWSYSQEFYVIGGVSSSYPVVTHPILNHTVYTTQPTLYWYLEGSSLGLTGFVVKYKKDSAPANWTAYAPGANDANGGAYNIASVDTIHKQIDDTNLDYGGHYFWAVYATDGVTPSAVSQGEFTVVGAGGGSVVLTSPGDGFPVYGSQVSLAWYFNGSTLGITGYEYLISDSDVFSTTFATGTTTAFYKDITGLAGGTTYFWKVRALPSGSWSAVYSFTVVPGSASIVVQPLVGGPSNISLTTGSPQLTWRVPVATAANASYEVQLADNSNFANAKVMTTSKAYVNTAGLQGGKTYYWKVRSVGATGSKSVYSSPATFSIGSVTAVEDEPTVPTEYELSQNYPNPFNPSTVINFAMPKSGYVTLKIYDMLGREVKTLISQQTEAGNHQVTWNGDDNTGSKVSSGAYVYRISAGNYVSVKKMVLIK